ncbi:MAG: nucleotidyltransferase [Ruminococcaceae bacterium]|nr:nucleotidyltransferase [Oscillospiraceae bacterium]
MKTTLLIMAAGIGSRYGAGIKQLAQVGPTGEIIMDYSIYDAIKAGFNKIVFIIRKDIEEDFKQIIGERIEKICNEIGVEVDYTFQCLENIPEGIKVPEGRTKPWGTGHAVLAAKDIVKEPFAVINADDYYGKEAFTKIHDFLVSDQLKANAFCMAGFILKNTLSDNGGVTRGICQVDDNGYLTDVVETSDIVKVGNGAQTKGVEVDVESLVSMNMWGLSPEFMDMLVTGFDEFFKTVDANPLKAEYLLPIYIGQLLRENKVSVKVLSTKDTWFGVTYQEDKDYVVGEFRKLIEAGVYKADLFSDL